MATELQRRRLSVEDYHRMGEAGIFQPGERLELLRGDVVTVPPSGHNHRGTINRLNRLLSAKFSDRAYVQVQSGVIVCDDSESRLCCQPFC